MGRRLLKNSGSNIDIKAEKEGGLSNMRLDNKKKRRGVGREV